MQPRYKRLDASTCGTSMPIVVIVAYANANRSMYAHFSDVAVKRGQTIKAGQFRLRGRTGRATGCHVHYGLYSPRDPDVCGRARGGQADEGAAFPHRPH